MNRNILFQISLAIIFIFSDCVKAQNANQLNLQKYWHYRYRLVNDYMIVGPGPGESLPAFGRNLWEGNNIVWGECPRYLGWYIGVLATEYRLLKNNGQSVDQTLTELYFAINALERLDRVAEVAYGKPAAPSNLNGFLIRDDVPSDFITSHSPNGTDANSQLNRNGNLQNIWPPYTIGSGVSGYVSNVNSEYTSGNSGAKDPMSMDQTQEIFVGLALVIKCVDDAVLQFYDKDGNFYSRNLYLAAKAEADRIVRYVKEGGDNFNQPWTIFDPNGDDVPNSQGGNFQAFAHGFAKAAEYITGTDYTGSGSEGIFYPAWKSAQNTKCGYQCPSGNGRIAMGFATVCDCWETNQGNTTIDGIKFHGYYDAGSLNFCGSECTTYPANHYGFDYYYGAVHRYLHDYSIVDDPLRNDAYNDLCDMQNILTSAPFEGPFFHCLIPGSFTDPLTGQTFDFCILSDIAPNDWGSSLRFSIAPDYQTTGSHSWRANYNGLDYMLFHNLYYLIQTNQHPLVTGTYPKFNLQGSTIFPYVYSSPIFHITVDNLYVANVNNTIFGDVSIYGGPQGVTVTNTTVDNGAYFYVTADGNSCLGAPQDYVFDPSWYVRMGGNINANNSSGENETAFYMTDEFKENPPNDYLLVNPTNDKNIKSVDYAVKEQGPLQLVMQDITGRIINTIISTPYHADGSFSINIEISALANGVYFITLLSKENKITKKIIIAGN